jgi:putative endonuclease
MKHGYVYIMSNWNNTVVYVGVTSNLKARAYQHKSKQTKSFSHRYNTKKLVYYEVFEDMYNAISREKEIKGWRREKKDKLIHSMNPGWRDLYEEL